MKILRVNMTTLSTDFEDLPEDLKILGGRALTSRILTDEVPPETDPLGPEAKLIFATSPLAGTMAPSCGRFSIGAKSPLTHGIKEANTGGPVGQKLDKMGIRAIVVEGKPADDKFYMLAISKDGVSLESADQYLGMRNYALVDALHEKYPKKSTIISIGVVGERKLVGASIDFTDKDGRASRHAARGGVGAVMGSKGLKAMVIDDSGASTVEIANRDAFRASVKEWVKFLPTDMMIQMYSAHGSACATDTLRAIGSMPVFNFGSEPLDNVHDISGQNIDEINQPRGGKMDACMPGCVVKCSVIFHDKEGNHLTSSYEYEATAMVGTNLGIVDPDVVANFDRICDEIGIDVIECGGAIGVAASAGKIEMGDPEAVLRLLDEIEKGTEFGNVLGNGVVATCKALGVDRIPAIKGQAIPAHDPRVGKGTGVTYLTNPMGADHTAGLCYDGEFMENAGAVERSLKKQIFMTTMDSMGYCYFATPSDLKATVDFVTSMVNARYGLELGTEDVLKVGRETLRREVAYNSQSGFLTLNNPDPEFLRSEPVAPLGNVFGIDDEELAKIWDNLDTIQVV
ncbi:MAG: aldehyde ferredoxin oxidoreductase [Proteobacteria bacterium]|nr:aldehyde ferredoxin oxidoreductase [Pseudomonadota bacterium]